MATRRIGVVVRKSLHENFFQLVKSEFANHELMEIDVNAGDRGTGFLPFTRFIRLIVFACNAKSFAIAVIFFLVFLLVPVFERFGQRFLCIFDYSLPRTPVTRSGLLSLDTFANVLVNAIFIAKF